MYINNSFNSLYRADNHSGFEHFEKFQISNKSSINISNNGNNTVKSAPIHDEILEPDNPTPKEAREFLEKHLMSLAFKLGYCKYNDPEARKRLESIILQDGCESKKYMSFLIMRGIPVPFDFVDRVHDMMPDPCYHETIKILSDKLDEAIDAMDNYSVPSKNNPNLQNDEEL